MGRRMDAGTFAPGHARLWLIVSRSPLRGVFNTRQTGWRDRPIVRINTGLSIATNPFLHWPDFSSQADERNHTNKGDLVRSACAAVDALMLQWVRNEGLP